MIFNNPPRFSIAHDLYPGTIVFTVTDKSPDTKFYKLLSYLAYIFRIILVVFAFSLYYPFFRPAPTPLSVPIFPYLVLRSVYKIVEVLGFKCVHELSFCMILVALQANISGHERYTKETLTLISGTLLMLSTENTGWFGCTQATNSQFLHLAQIQDMLIHEGYIGSKKKLVIAVIGEEEMIVVFPKFLPDLNILEAVGRELKKHIDPSTRLEAMERFLGVHGINGDNENASDDDEDEEQTGEETEGETITEHDENIGE